MSGRYDTGGSYQPLSPNFANFQVLAAPPTNPGKGRSYFDTTLGVGVYANSIWNYASGGGGAITSVFGRTGVIVSANGDYTFAQIGSTPTTVLGYGITDAVTTGSLGTGIAAFLATPTSANLATAITNETGSGALVFATSPTLVTPVLGVATASSVNNVVLTNPGSSATITLANGSTLATSGTNSITLTSTGATNVTLPTSGTLLAANQTVTLSGDVSGSGATAITTAIGANKVTLGMHATLASMSVIGNNTTATATPIAVNVPITIATGTVTNAATLDINMSTYNTLFTTIEVQLISFRPATNAAILEVRLSTDGTTFVATGYKWNFTYALAAVPGGQDDAGASDTTSIHLTGSSSSTTAQTISGEMKLYNPGVATFFPMVKFETARYNDTPATGIAIGMGLITTAQVTKGVRVLFSSGNISTGVYRVIGYV